MKARYPGPCAICDHDYDRDDQIVPWRGHYAHARCVSAERGE